MTDIPPPPVNEIPPPPSLDTDPHPGRTIVKSSRALLRQDKSLSLLPLVGGLCSLLAALPLVVAQLLFKDQSVITYVALVLAVFIGTTITTFFAVALSAGAATRMDGGDPTISSCIGVAKGNLWSIVRWGIFAASVGLIIRMLEKNLKGSLGLFARLLGDGSFAVASYFVIPMLAHEQIGPIDAVKKSMSTVRAQWRKALRFNVRMGLWAVGVFLLCGVIAGGSILVAINVGLANDASNSNVLLALLLVLVGVVVFVWGMLYIGAVSAYGRTALYRFATGRPVPGFSLEALQGAAKQS